MAVRKKETEELELDVDAAVAACGGDYRETIKALLVTNTLLCSELATSTSAGYSRRQIRKLGKAS